jgi:hypothetical protein
MFRIFLVTPKDAQEEREDEEPVEDAIRDRRRGRE